MFLITRNSTCLPVNSMMKACVAAGGGTPGRTWFSPSKAVSKTQGQSSQGRPVLSTPPIPAFLPTEEEVDCRPNVQSATPVTPDCPILSVFYQNGPDPSRWRLAVIPVHEAMLQGWPPGDSRSLWNRFQPETAQAQTVV